MGGTTIRWLAHALPAPTAHRKRCGPARAATRKPCMRRPTKHRRLTRETPDWRDVSTDHSTPDPRRSADRILDTAEGVLITLRRYHLNQAFIELARTSRRHAIPLTSLADALVALAQGQSTVDCETRAVHIARATWGALLDDTGRYHRAERGGRAHDLDATRSGRPSATPVAAPADHR